MEHSQLNKPQGPQFLSLAKGSLVSYQDKPYKVVHAISADRLILECPSTKLTVAAPVVDVRQIESAQSEEKQINDLSEYTEKDIEVAKFRHSIIKPLIGVLSRTTSDADKAAKKASVNRSTVYKWLADWEGCGHLGVLVPGRRGPNKGSTRTEEATEEVINTLIDSVYLQPKKVSVRHLEDKIVGRCRALNIDPPSYSTIMRRVAKINAEKTLRSRGNSAVAQYQRNPHAGTYDEARHPLEIVQIDHMQANIMLVDEEHRLAVERPWVTLAIDVYSRMVVGMYVSYDAPSFMSASMCLANTMLPKEAYLTNLGVEGSWPVWGPPSAIHCDNAKEFRGAKLEKACSYYGIGLNLRPIKKTHYGGHIERLVGTLKSFIDDIDGTTKRNVADKGEYDSEGEATLTIAEFERVLAKHIVNVYHKKPKKLDAAPLQKWEAGLIGEGDDPGIGLMPRPENPQRIIFDLLPGEERTISPTGVLIDNVQYFHECLSPWVGATTDERRSVDPKNKRLIKRKFMFRRDPRDISRIWFFDPELREYFEIPYRDSRMRPMSLFELNAAIRKIKADNRIVDQSAIYEALASIDNDLAEAKSATKAVRSQASRKRRREKASADVLPERTPIEAPAPTPTLPSFVTSGLLSDDIQPFEELEL